MFIQMDRIVGILCSKPVIEQQQAPPIHRITSCVNDENQLHYLFVSDACTAQQRMYQNIFISVSKTPNAYHILQCMILAYY